jgi:hypothetical protein
MGLTARCVALLLIASSAWAQQPPSAAHEPETISTGQFSQEVTAFLGRELDVHVADISSLNPPPERVLGARTGGDFTWGTFTRAVASYAALSGQRTVGGRDVIAIVGQGGLIEARQGGKTFAQMYSALALRSFGSDLKTNPVWQALTPDEQAQWRALLDPSRFYDRKSRRVINLAENYFGVAARVVAMDYQMGIISDRTFVDDVLDRAAEPFTKGALYSDDNVPTGRYDRYSNEYARNVYIAAEDVGRKDLMTALEPTLRAQIETWWDLLSPDGYGYPWGRSLGAVSYVDTMEIVAFLAQHPEFRPAPMPQLASAYFAAWQWLQHDYQPDRHLLNVFAFGRGNYRYITPEREWQQTTDVFGKISGAHAAFVKVMKAEHIISFPAHLTLPEVARFEYFRKGERPAGVWLVRHGPLRFALPITTGPKPGLADYLPAPHGLPGYAAPVEETVPALTPYLELADGRIIVAGDGADEIIPSSDGLALRAVWKRWAELGAKSGELVDPGITTQVDWEIHGNTLVRSERISTTKNTAIHRFWVIVSSRGDRAKLRFENGSRIDRLVFPEGSLEVTIKNCDWPLQVELEATGNSNLGKGSRGYIPLYLDFEAHDVLLTPEKPMAWTLVLRALP